MTLLMKKKSPQNEYNMPILDRLHVGSSLDTDWQISAWVKVFISKTTEIS